MSTFKSRIAALSPVGLVRCAVRLFHSVRTFAAEEYRNPADAELASIEARMMEMGLSCHDFCVDATEFDDFIRLAGFPSEYHGGIGSGVYREKLLEHFVAWKFLGLDDCGHAPYLDIAAGGSPWVLLLRNRGVNATAIDISISPEFRSESSYQQLDATRTGFEDGSAGSASLQCAFEMFSEDQDVALLQELGRILRPGGRAVISPLYTHTHACYYQTPEYYGSACGEHDAKRYIRRDCWGVSFSRKYSPETLKTRVWDRALKAGLLPSLHVLRNKHDLGDGIYLHYILVLDKP